jgi:catechol 2,3-dioxygenase-like lactoylglutathione lyase family enzyme
MFSGAHVVVYSKNAEADRAFFRDVLGFKWVDAGSGRCSSDGSKRHRDCSQHNSDGNGSFCGFFRTSENRGGSPALHFPWLHLAKEVPEAK